MASAVVIAPMIAGNINNESAAVGSVLTRAATGFSAWQSVAGGGTLTNGAANAGQKVVTVDSTTGLLAGATVAYTLVGGVIESKTIATVDSATQITLSTNIGTGGIANDTYLAAVPPGTLLSTGTVVGATGAAQAFTTGVRVGAGWGADDTAINAKRTLTGVVNSHAYRDESALTPATDSVGYASFDSQYTLAGSISYDHFAAFQNRPVFSGSGTITKHAGFWSLPVHGGAGTITSLYHNWVWDVQGGGTVTTQYGLYVNELAGGGTNWAVFTAGATPSFFGGNVWTNGTLRVDGLVAFGNVAVNTAHQVYCASNLDATKVVNLAVTTLAPVNISSGTTYGVLFSNRGDNNTLASIGTNDIDGLYGSSGLGASSANSAARYTRAGHFQSSFSAATGKTAQATNAYGVLVDAISATGAGTISIGAAIGIGINNQGTSKASAAYGLFIDSQSGSPTNYAIYTGAGDVRLMASATDKLGFHGATPVAQQTLATGAGATVDNVITALQNLGLVKQS